jgi:hypothetical protein
MARDPENPFHEGMALDAALKRIESRDGLVRADVTDPEALKLATPIDLACRLGAGPVGFEHTGIEAFPGQIRLNKEAAALFDPVCEAFKGLAGKGECIQLLVPVDATKGLRSKDIAAVRDALCRWIADAASTVPQSRYPRHLLPIMDVTPNGVPFPVSLHRFYDCGAMSGVFWYVRKIAMNEADRLDRFIAARDKKFGKLATWKAATSGRTILVLEDADISLTNEQLVADTFAKAEEGRADQPDEVYVVTSFTSEWYVTCLRRPGRTYYDDGERYWKIDPAALTDLTGR